VLKKYKENGTIFDKKEENHREAVILWMQLQWFPQK
jgi:hypothetical protein